MKTIGLVFPHQLFKKTSLPTHTKDIVLIEDFLFFRQHRFHKQKLMLHRASMKSYEKYLRDQGCTVTYLDTQQLHCRKAWSLFLKKHHYTHIVCYDVVDTWLENDINHIARELKISITWVPTLSFINTRSDNDTFFKKDKKPFMKTFYEWQRKRTGILMDPEGKPLGGKFSFDTENRKKFPPAFTDQKPYTVTSDSFTRDSKIFVEKEFPDAYGENSELAYAHDFSNAEKILNTFISHRLAQFGDYEDALDESIIAGYHSIISPYLNNGLLTPSIVIEKVLAFFDRHPETPLNSLEGFIRQLLGWREFMRAMYEYHGTSMRTKNFFNHKEKLPDAFWSATTGNYVLDTTIKKVITHAYCHHIERLMVLGNYMLLAEINPHYVYQWFMELFIDAYDWVMVPNVYGMSQFADGGIFATKPYIGASNYILKMSHYKKDGIWDKDFDEKFWNFLKKHKTFLSKNPRMRMLLGRIAK